MQLSELAGRRVVLLGLGADVRAAVPAILGAGPASVVAVDDGHPVGAVIDGVTVVDRAVGVAAAEVFVRSPGFPRTEPDLAAARQGGTAMTTPIDLWLGSAPGLAGGPGARRRWIGVTGTKGKSTVTELCGSLARAAEAEVGVAGNLGIPVFAAGWVSDAPLLVLEISSYQAADLHHVPDVAVLTSLSEDHVSWHGGVERYVADKLRLLRNEGGVAATVLVAEAEERAQRAVVELGLTPVLVADPAAVPAGVPVHRARNAALAAAALAAAGVAPIDPAAVLAAAEGSLPGRLDRCPGGSSSGVVFVDDALASNPSATAAGLAWARGFDVETVVVLGGVDRSVDPAPLVAEVARWVPGRLRAVAVPDSGVELAARCGVELAGVADDVGAAVVAAVEALGEAGPGAIVLFSPAAPTPPRQGNWERRSEAFRAAAARWP